MSAKLWIGMKIVQVASEAPEYDKHKGRQGTVEDAFEDENGSVHCKTREDGVWCPARLLAPLPPMI